MNDSGLFVKLEPKQVEGAVDIAIRSALAEVMGRDPDALVKAVVNAALSQQSANGYGPKGTLFAKAIDSLVQEEAKAAVGDIIEGQRERIREVLVERLTRELDPAKLAGSFADTLVSAITASMFVSVNLTVGPRVNGNGEYER